MEASHTTTLDLADRDLLERALRSYYGEYGAFLKQAEVEDLMRRLGLDSAL